MEKFMKTRNSVRIALLAALTLALAASAAGCAKNVDKIEFTKWGNSFVPPQRNTSGVDTTAQGGAAQNGVVPQNGINAMPKASLGGAYHRTFASSAHYRMVGGFHVTSNQ